MVNEGMMENELQTLDFGKMRQTANNISRKKIVAFAVCCCLALAGWSQKNRFNVIGFYSGKHDAAHISFVHEADLWFAKMAGQYSFTYDSTNNWYNLNTGFLSNYQLVIFLDARPDSLDQRLAFQQYMENGGAWMGFHFAGFALTPSAYPQNWDWYHNQFLGSGEYVSNTWRPTSAILRIEWPRPL